MTFRNESEFHPTAYLVPHLVPNTQIGQHMTAHNGNPADSPKTDIVTRGTLPRLAPEVQDAWVQWVQHEHMPAEDLLVARRAFAAGYSAGDIVGRASCDRIN